MAAEDGSTICKSCGFEMKAKTVDIVFKSFCPGWMKSPKRLQSCWRSKLCHVWHSPHSISSSLLSLSRGLSPPMSFHCSFSWRWSWKVSETCLRHILSLYLIYDLTASKYQSYLNCHRHKHDNLQKKHLSRLRASHPTTDISFIQSGQFARGRNLKSTTNICPLAIFKVIYILPSSRCLICHDATQGISPLK